MKAPSTWPVVIKNGSATVRIYRNERGIAGATYTDYRVTYYDSEGKRRMESFADYGDADRKARTVAASITQGDAKGLTLTASERLAYLRAVGIEGNRRCSGRGSSALCRDGQSDGRQLRG